MASESQTSTTETPTQSFLERLINSRNTDLSVLIPFILGFATTPLSDPDHIRVELPESTTDPDHNSPNRSTHDDSTQLERTQRSQRTILLDSILGYTSSVPDPDATRVETSESTTDPVDNSQDHPSPDESNESTQLERAALYNSFLSFTPSVPDPGATRVEPPEPETDPVENSRNRTSPGESTQLEQVILINSLTRNMVVMEGVFGKGGQPPASRSAVEKLPRVKIEEEEKGGECVICLEEYVVGSMVKKMPCQHGFHDTCIDTWLGIHGSCPVCRYEMPVDRKSEEREGGGGRVNREFVWVSFGGGGGELTAETGE